MAKKPYFVHEPSASGTLDDLILVLWHGAGGDVDHAHIRGLATAVTSKGAVAIRARFPYRVAGKRGPDRMPKLIGSIRELLDQLDQDFPGRRRVLGGRSMGGRAASMAVADGVEAAGLLFLAYPLHPAGKPEKLRDAHLPDIPCPMLFLSGDRDALCRMDLLEPVLRRIEDRATLHVYEGADHSFRRVDSEAINAVALPWLSQL